MNLLPGLETTSSALTAEKLRLNIIGQNIANAQTTRGPDGQPYSRQMVAFETKLMEVGKTDTGAPRIARGVQVREIREDETPGPMVFNPGHPDANARGMVRMPNVNLTHEMVDMIAATRAYEANLEVMRTSKQIATKALAMGKA